LPIVGQLAGAFGVDAATLVMETLRGMEIPDPVWTAVMDVQGVKDAAGLWNPSPGGRLLSPVLQLSVLLEPAWHPCVEVRGIDSAESGWLSHPERLPHLLPGLSRTFREMIESDAFPEAGMNDPVRAFPFTGGSRKFAYLREPGVLVPDPLELALRQLGEVELHSSAPDFLAREDVVRVAWVEPGTASWDRLRETPRRTVLLHHRPIPRRMALGAHAELLLPAPLAVLDRVLRSRD